MSFIESRIKNIFQKFENRLKITLDEEDKERLRLLLTIPVIRTTIRENNFPLLQWCQNVPENMVTLTRVLLSFPDLKQWLITECIMT